MVTERCFGASGFSLAPSVRAESLENPALICLPTPIFSPFELRKSTRPAKQNCGFALRSRFWTRGCFSRARRIGGKSDQTFLLVGSRACAVLLGRSPCSTPCPGHAHE